MGHLWFLQIVLIFLFLHLECVARFAYDVGTASVRAWWNGRHTRLKIWGANARGGSSPPARTTRPKDSATISVQVIDNIHFRCLTLVLGWRECWPNCWPKNSSLSLTAAVIITFQGVYQLTWFTIIRVLGYLRVCEQTCMTANRWKVHNYAIWGLESLSSLNRGANKGKTFYGAVESACGHLIKACGAKDLAERKDGLIYWDYLIAERMVGCSLSGVICTTW